MPFPVAESLIDAAERELGRPLPENLRTRLLQENGGEVEADNDDWYLHPVPDSSDRRRLKRTANNLFRETEAARRWSSFPSDAIAIAENAAGDRLILRADKDEVERWAHDTGEVSPIHVNWFPRPVGFGEHDRQNVHVPGEPEQVLQGSDLDMARHVSDIPERFKDARQRHAYFLRQVAEQGYLWSLRDESGWVMAGDDEGRQYFPVWPHAELARECAVDNWKGNQPQKISLTSWLQKWTPGLHKDQTKVVVFPLPTRKGFITSPLRLADDLRRGLEFVRARLG